MSMPTVAELLEALPADEPQEQVVTEHDDPM